MEVVEEEVSSPFEALEELKKKEEEEGEESLTRRQSICLEDLRKNLTLQDGESREEIRQELSNVRDFKDNQLEKLLEILPTTEAGVRALFSKERIKMKDSEVEKVKDICQSLEQE